MSEYFFQLAFIAPGGPEFLVVILVLLLLFGTKEAPRIFRKINRFINSMRNTTDGFKRELLYGDLENAEQRDSSPEEECQGEAHNDGENDYCNEVDEKEEPCTESKKADVSEKDTGDACKT